MNPYILPKPSFFPQWLSRTLPHKPKKSLPSRKVLYPKAVFLNPFLPTAHLRPHKNIKAHLAKFKRIHIQILRDGTTDLKKNKNTHYYELTYSSIPKVFSQLYSLLVWNLCLVFLRLLQYLVECAISRPAFLLQLSVVSLTS